MIPFVDLGRQYKSIKADVDDAIHGILESGTFVLGAPVQKFELEFAQYCGVRHTVGVGNGTDALAIALQAMGVSIGDEVIVPANTFIATALAVSHVGATLKLVDVDPRTNLIMAETVRAAFTPRTKVVIPVHLFGKPVDMAPLMAVCRAANVLVLEDACQAHGARYRGQRVGSFGHAAAFSFYPGKNLGAYGDAGAITTNDDALAERIRLTRDLGQRQKYEHVLVGRNSRLDALQAAVLSVKLSYLDDWNEQRRHHAASYDLAFEELGVPTNSVTAGESAQHLYCITVDDRESVIASLRERGIGYGIHYPTPIHLHAAYRDLGYVDGAFPVSEAWSRHTISLPMFAELRGDEISDVVSAVSTAVAHT